MHSVDRFFEYARERYQILLRRQAGGPGPWTEDPILRRFQFCNVFREDDKTTQWFAPIRQAYRGDPSILEATIIFRWFNRIETGQVLRDSNLLFNWNSDRARADLKDLNPLVTGAYMIKTPPKMNKLEGLIWCIENVLGKRLVGRAPISCRTRPIPVSCRSKAHELMKYGNGTLQEMTEWLQQFPYLGSFMAYEVATDLRHTSVLHHALDINSWANPGPGSARGWGRVETGDPGVWNYQSRQHRAEIIGGMRELLDLSREDRYWPSEWPKWEMREVEHTLCEFDKYERARLGQGRPKQLFRGA